MSVNQLGRIAFNTLDNYTIKGAGLDLGEQYWENAVKEIISSRQATGVIYGGAVTVVSALQVKIAKGLALFGGGQMVAWDDQNVTLNAANSSNPRYDRIELAYSLNDHGTDLDNDNNTVVLDRIHVATATALAGTPAGSPVAPTRTIGRLSMALIHVAANQVSLSGGDIDLTEDSAVDLSYSLLGSSPYGIRYNVRLGLIQSTTDGATWHPALVRPANKIITHADSPYTVTAAQPNLEVDTSGGGVEVRFPALASSFPIELTKITGDANTVTVTPSGSEKINDDASDSLAQKYSNKLYEPLSIGWVIR